MEKTMMTDWVVDTNSREHIVVLQPACTAGMRKFEDFNRLPGGDLDDKCCHMIEQVFAPGHFVHVGNVTLRRGWNDQEPELSDFKRCGDFFEISTNGGYQNNRIGITCSSCGTEANSYIEEKQFPNILLHLLMKQMMPSLRMCNYLWIEEVGTVGILRDMLGLKEGDSRWKADLGFVLMPGMDTREGFAGFDQWMRYLLQIKFDQLQQLHEAMLPDIIGPQHFGELNRGRRFWRI